MKVGSRSSKLRLIILPGLEILNLFLGYPFEVSFVSHFSLFMLLLVILKGIKETKDVQERTTTRWWLLMTTTSICILYIHCIHTLFTWSLAIYLIERLDEIKQSKRCHKTKVEFVYNHQRSPPKHCGITVRAVGSTLKGPRFDSRSGNVLSSKYTSSKRNPY